MKPETVIRSRQEHRPLACALSGDFLRCAGKQRVTNPLAPQTASLCSSSAVLSFAVYGTALLQLSEVEGSCNATHGFQLPS